MFKKIIKNIIKLFFSIFLLLYKCLPKKLRIKIKNKLIKTFEKLYTSTDNYKQYQDNKIYQDSDNYINDIFQIGKKSHDYIEYKENNITFSEEDVKPIACYLPQFHTIPENDKWWGKGFTEWTNVTKAMPLFYGHYQPHLPLETFYDLSDINIIKNQVSLAKNYGIYGFMFHYYWFSGKRLLEKPLELFLENKDINFPFCINWANHHWTRVWDTDEKNMLIEQIHSEEDDLACIKDISRYLKDDRYIKVNGKPLISIFNPTFLPNPNKTINIWRKYCRENNIGEIHIVGMDYNLWDPLIYDFDGAIAESPHDITGKFSEHLCHTITSINKKTKCNIFNMEKYVKEKMYLNDGRKNIYRGIIPSFDNTARRKDNVHILKVTPNLYQEWLYDIMHDSNKHFDKGNRFVFINAWNEWAESAHLEPDRKYGYAYLQATADTIKNIKNDISCDENIMQNNEHENIIEQNNESLDEQLQYLSNKINNKNFGINFIGYFNEYHSIGEVARSLVKKFKITGIPFTIYSVNSGANKIPDNEFQEYKNYIVKKSEYPINIIIANANQLQKLYENNKNIFKNKKNIGVWFWEFETGIGKYADSCKYIDGLMVYNQYIRKCVEKYLPNNFPISVNIFPYIHMEENLININEIRRKYGIPYKSFTVFFNFDYVSSYDRKNPEAILNAFNIAFKNNDNARLIIKTNSCNKDNKKSEYFKKLTQNLGISSQVHIIDDYFNKIEMQSLINASNVYISLHRAEGLGLGLLEAMYFGKPVIASNYSGNLDFMTNDNSILIDSPLVPANTDFEPYKDVEYWAEPDINSAAKALSKLYEDQNFSQLLGKKGQLYVRERFNNKNFIIDFSKFIDFIYEKIYN